MAFPSPQELLAKIQGGSSSSTLFSAPTSTPSAFPSPQALLSQTQAQQAGPSFGSTLLSKGLAIGKSILQKAGSFFGDAGAQFGDIVTGKAPQLTPADYLHGIKATGSGIDFLAKGFNEGVGRILKSTSEAVIGREATDKIANFGGSVSLGSLSKAATGQDSLISYQDIYNKSREFALENKADDAQAGTFASLAVIGSLFADNPLMGPGKGSVFKLSEQAVKDITKESAEEAIRAILKAENPALTERELEAMTPVFRDAKTPEEVKSAADQLSKIQQAPLKGEPADDTIPTPDEMLARMRGDAPPVKTADIPGPEATPSYFRSLEGDEPRFVPVDGKPVQLSEGLETFIHQPENGAFEVLEATTGRRIGQPGETAEAAIKSAQEALEGKTPEAVKAIIDSFPNKASRETPPVPASVRATERSQPALNVPKPFDQNLIRTISKEDLPGPILDKMRLEFPALSDQALTPIAGRLAKLKRTGDIEGILQVVRNISEDITRARTAAGTKAGPIRISKEALDKSIAIVSDKKAVGDMPPSIGQLMTSAERGKYLDNIQRAIKDPEQAVLAQQEYEALWEHADQRILDRYEELKIQRDLMRDAADNTPGRELYSLYKGTFLSPDDYGLDDLADKMKGKKLGKEIDARIEDIMGGSQDKEAAQKALEDYRGMRGQISEVEAELREIRPKARAARILQSMVEDVPVIARKEAGEIEALANPDDIRKAYKDISGFAGQARDVYRNFEHVFGERFKDVKRAILDPFDKSKGQMIDDLRVLGDDLEANVVKKYGINRGSKESAAIQRYGDTSLMEGERVTLEGLVEQFGREKAEQIVAADGYFRKTYNDLIEKVNKVRAEIYPNDPSKLIPKRKDYYRHFTELGDGFRALMDLFETPAGISPELAGLSEWTKPKSKFLSFAQERVGKSSTIDAIGGFLDYAPSYAYAVNIDQHIGKFRYLRRRLAESSPVPGVRELIDMGDKGKALVEQKGINNFLEYLDNFANDLAGKTNPMDRYLQMVMPGGRKTFRVINWINSRVKANAILGNLASAVAQAANIPNGIASAKFYTLPGIERTLAGIVTPNDAIAASSFIKERYKEDLTKRFKVDWVEHPVRGTTDRGRDFAAWITGALDEMGTKLIWNSHYAKGVAEGVEDPIKYADDITRSLVAGRGIGEVPLVQKSKVFQLIAPFQLEVGNAWYVLSKFIKRRDFGAVATLLVANYLFNRAAEQIRGTPVLFDPINSLIDGATQASDEMQDHNNPGRAAYKFAGRQVGEILSNVPFGQTVAAAIPDDFVKDTFGFDGGKKELFGSADPGRFGGGLLAVSGIMDPLYKLVPPFGGAQIKRTIDGVNAMLQGQVKDAGGKLSFNVEQTPLNVVKAVLFGKNATQEAREFYDERDDLFQRIYRQNAERDQNKIEAEGLWADIKKLPKDQALSRLQALEASDPDMAEAVADVADSEASGLTGTERLIKMLGVENGERAKYISDTVDSLKTREEQVAYLQNLDEKKLISDDVFDQLMYLLKGKFKPATSQ